MRTRIPWRLAKLIENVPHPAPEHLTPEQLAEWERIMAEQNKPRRDNDGSWIIVDDGGERVCTVAFRGKAKRGQAYQAPDPEGEALARLIVDAVNQRYTP